ncbi:MAG: YihA family ribosome biogenesis GTP-binding protein [Proteobacteria bacterium]|nr:YihA family ribosome biogenesis GTP-binding protein [Pseudomonadota bacterium]
MPAFPETSFLTSAAAPKQFVADTGAEVAFAGRSNAGKSSALNALTGRRALARVSRTPGRTQLVNFFAVAGAGRLVDLPGYGFAKVPDSVRAGWRSLIQAYFEERESLAALVLIVDSRRGLGEQDVVMLEWVLARGRHAYVLLTKSDKLTRAQAARVLAETREACVDAGVGVQLFSAHAGRGVEEARAAVMEFMSGGGGAQ